MNTVGKWEAVDIRAVWPREDTDFTPWLAQNIDELARVLGLDLQVDQTEIPVGDFKLDILAHDEGSQRVVAIENQYGKTDHDHLGKLITYAAGVQATILVWLVEDFREEHRAALDWLNLHSDDDVQIFGVLLQARRIGSSEPAPVFDIVCSPNGWAKDQKRKAVAAVRSPLGAIYRRFYQTVVDTLRAKGVSNLKVAQPDNWMDVASGVTGIPIQLAFTKGGRAARVQLYISPRDEAFNRRVFEVFQRDKVTIERGVKATLDWDTRYGRKYSSIGLTREADIRDESQWPTVRTWMVDTVMDFRRVFPENYLREALTKAEEETPVSGSSEPNG